MKLATIAVLTLAFPVFLYGCASTVPLEPRIPQASSRFNFRLAENNSSILGSATLGTRANMTIDVNEVDKATIRIAGTSSAKLPVVLMPFVSDFVDHTPFDAVAASTIIGNQWSVVFLATPGTNSSFTLTMDSSSIVSSDGDVRKINLDFSYSNAPLAINQILNSTSIVARFDSISLSIAGSPAILGETPHYTRISGG